MHRLSNLTALDLSDNAMEREGRLSVVEGCARIANMNQLHGGCANWSERDTDLEYGRRILGQSVTYTLDGHAARSMEDVVW